MTACVSGPASWIIDDREVENSELEKKYKSILMELSKSVGAAANSGDIKAYQFLVHYIAMIMQGGFDVLKDTVQRKEDLEEFEKFFKI